MKIHKPLIIPEDSSWGRFTIRKYIPNWLNSFFDGVKNIIRWIPVIYKDKDYDSYYIYEVLKRKLINQRAYLVKHNRHMGISDVNRYITICLNLIERLQSDYYDMEYMDYEKSTFEFTPSVNHPGCSKLHSEIITENLHDYLVRYRNQTRIILKKCPRLSINTPKEKLKTSIKVAQNNHNRCVNLLFRILNDKIENWWD